MNLEEIGRRYRITTDLHTHTRYSRMGLYFHAKGTILENVRSAHEKGIKELAITDHGPKEMYGLDEKLIPRMRQEIQEAMEQYPDVKVYLGVEANLMHSPNGLDVKPENIDKYDFINAGYHYGVPRCGMMLNWIAFKLPSPAWVKEKARKHNTALAIKALYNNNIKVLTHPGDKAYFDMEALAAACEETGTIVEINARHRHPDAADIRIFAKHKVDFIISSDAHKAEQVGRYVKSMALALEAGLPVERILNIEEK